MDILTRQSRQKWCFLLTNLPSFLMRQNSRMKNLCSESSRSISPTRSEGLNRQEYVSPTPPNQPPFMWLLPTPVISLVNKTISRQGYDVVRNKRKPTQVFTPLTHPGRDQRSSHPPRWYLQCMTIDNRNITHRSEQPLVISLWVTKHEPKVEYNAPQSNQHTWKEASAESINYSSSEPVSR